MCQRFCQSSTVTLATTSKTPHTHHVIRLLFAIYKGIYEWVNTLSNEDGKRQATTKKMDFFFDAEEI